MQSRKWLVDLRKEAGFSQQMLADEVGISRSYLSEIENGIKAPAGATAVKIAKVLKFDMSLFYGDESRVSRHIDHTPSTA